MKDQFRDVSEAEWQKISHLNRFNGLSRTDLLIQYDGYIVRREEGRIISYGLLSLLSNEYTHVPYLEQRAKV